MNILALTKLIINQVDANTDYSAYDRPSETRPFPYVTVDGHSEIRNDVHGQYGTSINIVLHTWSRSDGKVETMQIQNDLYELFHQQRFTEDATEFLFDFLDSQILVDPDNKTMHGVTRFQVIAF